MAHLNAGPKDAIEHTTVITRRTPRGLFGNIGLDHGPFAVAES